jgi:hypothetical protein
MACGRDGDYRKNKGRKGFKESRPALVRDGDYVKDRHSNMALKFVDNILRVIGLGQGVKGHGPHKAFFLS